MAVFLIAVLCLAHPRGFAHETDGEAEMLAESLNRVETLQLEVTRLRKKNERLRRSLARMKTRMRKLSGEMRQLNREMRKMRAEAAAASREQGVSNQKERRVGAPSSTERATLAPKRLTSEQASASVATSVSATVSEPNTSPNWYAHQ